MQRWGDSKFCLLFSDDQLHTKLNEKAIDKDSCIHSSAQGTVAEARPLWQICLCSSGSKLSFCILQGMYATSLDANGVYTKERLHCSLESGVRKKLRAIPASFYQAKRPIDFNAYMRSKLLCCSTTTVHWAKFCNGVCRRNSIPIRGTKPSEWDPTKLLQEGLLSSEILPTEEIDK